MSEPKEKNGGSLLKTLSMIGGAIFVTASAVWALVDGRMTKNEEVDAQQEIRIRQNETAGAVVQEQYKHVIKALDRIEKEVKK